MRREHLGHDFFFAVMTMVKWFICLLAGALFAVIAPASLAGCSLSECETDADCAGDSQCIDGGGVFLSYPTCESGIATDSTPGDDAGIEFEVTDIDDDAGVSPPSEDTGTPDADFSPINAESESDTAVDDEVDTVTCVAPSSAEACASKECGEVTVYDTCGDAHSFSCGFCGAGETCQDHSCVNLRADSGLILLYTFTEGEGETVYDRSGVGAEMNLVFHGNVAWGGDCDCLEFNGGAVHRAQAHKLYNRLSGNHAAFTVELWLEPFERDQGGPARIFSYSQGHSARNFQFAHGSCTNCSGNADFHFRVRHQGDERGDPFMDVHNQAELALTHSVITFDNGTFRYYKNGAFVTHDNNSARSGNLTNWDSSFALLLGNEVSGQRPWLGRLYMVAVYDRALSDDEVTHNYIFGPDVDGP